MIKMQKINSHKRFSNYQKVVQLQCINVCFFLEALFTEGIDTDDGGNIFLQ